jgi:cytochrome P450
MIVDKFGNRAFAALLNLGRQRLVFNDPPLHTRVRHLIAGALSPRALSSAIHREWR